MSSNNYYEAWTVGRVIKLVLVSLLAMGAVGGCVSALILKSRSDQESIKTSKTLVGTVVEIEGAQTTGVANFWGKYVTTTYSLRLDDGTRITIPDSTEVVKTGDRVYHERVVDIRTGDVLSELDSIESRESR